MSITLKRRTDGTLTVTCFDTPVGELRVIEDKIVGGSVRAVSVKWSRRFATGDTCKGAMSKAYLALLDHYDVDAIISDAYLSKEAENFYLSLSVDEEMTKFVFYSMLRSEAIEQGGDAESMRQEIETDDGATIVSVLQDFQFIIIRNRAITPQMSGSHYHRIP